MRVYLDDIRPAPDGWHQCFTSRELIDLLKSENTITHISLDHDLGPPEAGTGYDILLYLMERCFNDWEFTMPHVQIHSANPVGVQHMKQALSRIHDFIVKRGE